MTHPDHPSDPWEWARLLLGDSAALLTRTGAAVCATGTIGATRVSLAVEHPGGTAADAAVALRAIEVARSTGALLVTVTVDGGLDLADADLGRWLREAHRLSGTVPRVGLHVGAPASGSLLRRGTSDMLARVSEEDGDLATVDAGVEWVRNVVAFLPENDGVAAPEGPRLAPDTIDALSAGSGHDLLDALADDAPIVLHDGGIVLSLCRIDGQSMAGIASALGGAPDGVDVRAAARLLSFCDAFHLPVVVVWDSAGEVDADPEIDALARAVAESATPLVTLVTGRALGALGQVLTSTALGIREVLAWPHAHIGHRGVHAEIAARADLDDADRADALAARHAATTLDVPGADRVIAPAESLRELHAALIRWGTVDDAEPLRHRGVLTR